MKKYCIYHIKGVKIGVGTNPEIRVKQQGYTDFEILEVYTNIFKVSEREIELQKEYGYKVDKVPYWKTYQQREKYRSKENCSKGGKIGGKTTGKKAQKEGIGFFGIPMEERKKKWYSKPRPYRRFLSQKQIDFVKDTHYPIKTQFDIIPIGKMSTGQLAKHFNVSKTVIRKALTF